MEKVFDRISVMKTLKDGIKKGYWTLEDLDKPSPQWKEVVDTSNGHPSYVRGYQGVKFEKDEQVAPKPRYFKASENPMPPTLKELGLDKAMNGENK